MTFYTLDFETKSIIKGSNKSPQPVGISIKVDNDPSFYHAWDHPTENNTTFENIKQPLKAICEDPANEVCFHNAKFDARIIREWFNIDIKAKIHDTMIMAYLYNPRFESLSLKPLAEKMLGIPPDDQKRLKEYIMRAIPKASEANWGAFIAYGPGKLVGSYAETDTDMTYGLYRLFKSFIQEG